MGFETACSIRKDNIWYTEDVNTATCKKCLQIARKTRPELFSNADRAQKIIQTEKDKVRLGITQSKLKVTAIGS